MQIKTTLRFHFTLIRMTKIKASGDNTCWRGCVERETLLHCWWDCKLEINSTLEINLEVPQKIGNRSTEDLAIPLLGIYPKDAPPCHRSTCSTMFIVAIFVVARSWKEHRCPTTEEWIQKMWFIYTMECCSAIKDEDILSFAGK